MNHDERLEIRVIELAPDGFTFRLPGSYGEEGIQIKEIHLHFFTQEYQEYKHVPLKEFHITKKKHADFWVLFRVDTQQSDYAKACKLLSREYMDYLTSKLYLDDAELSERMTGYPAYKDEIIASNEQEQYKRWISDYEIKKQELQYIDDTAEIKDSYHYGLQLAQKHKIEKLLSIGIHQYIDDLLKIHPLNYSIDIQKIYIGNSYCIHQLPDLDLIIKMIAYAKENHLEIGFIIPPVAQSHFEKISKMIDRIEQKLEELQYPLSIECNDQGLLQVMKKRKSEYLSFEKGILFYKMTKDPRMHYRKGMEEMDLPLDQGEKTIYFPYVQMNTATFCTTYAHAYNGSRGLQERVIHCAQPCEQYCMLYPDHLHMIGKYNCLFYWDITSLIDPSFCKKYVTKDKEWLVLNL